MMQSDPQTSWEHKNSNESMPFGMGPVVLALLEVSITGT